MNAEMKIPASLSHPSSFILRPYFPGAFTLVETVICVVIVSLMLVSALDMLGTSARLRRLQGDQSRAALLGRQLLSEIVQYNYAEPGSTNAALGPDSGETRASFDDVDDYNGWSESPPQTANGAAIAGFSGWSRSVTVEYIDVTNPGTISAADTGIKRVTVTVTAPGGRTYQLVALRSRYSAYEKSYTSSSSYPSCMEITLQIGTDSSTRITTSANLVNQVP